MNMIGVAALSALLDDHVQRPTPRMPRAPAARALGAAPTWLGWSTTWRRDGHGLVMCMGKGGVGKTTVAAAIAVALAHRGHEVHLTTTDPAATPRPRPCTVPSTV